MKILKYIVLLLFTTGASILLFTLFHPSEYDFTINKRIETPIEKVSPFIKANPINIGSRNYVEADNILIKNTEYSIKEEIKINNKNATVLEWKLKKINKNTLLNLRISGKMNFILKLKMFSYGGIKPRYENSIDEYLLKLNGL